MTKKLFKVTYQFVGIVAADDWADAVRVGSRVSRDIYNDDPCGIEFVEEITDVEDIPTDWRDCLPYGTDDKRPVQAYFASDAVCQEQE